MALINKDIIIAEIERRMSMFSAEKAKEGASANDKLSLGGRIGALEELKVFINGLDALEVKEVDLKKEINTWYDYGFPNEEELLDYIAETAKYFFELGLKTQKGE